MKNARRPGPVVRWILRAPAQLYDWKLGWLLGHRFLRLTHVGRRSGRHYRTVLEVMGTGQEANEVIVLSGQGPTADWYRNIQAQPPAEVAIGRRRFRPEHRILEPAEAVATLADYERRNRWVRPILQRTLTRLVGWKYDGSAEARQRLARQLPCVAFRPVQDDFERS
jgi:deazaflavin-dependent oxidoreductase (nitroreductase family)